MPRTRELERDSGKLPLFAFAEVALDTAALHKHRLPRCVRSGHPDAARNDGPVAPLPDGGCCSKLVGWAVVFAGGWAVRTGPAVSGGVIPVRAVSGCQGG
jgi:hypothetical protein